MTVFFIINSDSLSQKKYFCSAVRAVVGKNHHRPRKAGFILCLREPDIQYQQQGETQTCKRGFCYFPSVFILSHKIRSSELCPVLPKESGTSLCPSGTLSDKTPEQAKNPFGHLHFFISPQKQFALFPRNRLIRVYPRPVVLSKVSTDK